MSILFLITFYAHTYHSTKQGIILELQPTFCNIRFRTFEVLFKRESYFLRNYDFINQGMTFTTLGILKKQNFNPFFL